MGTRTAGRADVVLATDGSLSAQWAEVWITNARWETRAHARTVIERVASRLGAGTSEVSIELRPGHPLQVCREVAVDTGADLVVITRQQQPPGSYPFAQKLARYLPTSVLLMPED